ncbi:hypothetical protein ACFS7Z_23165 [Pontibacter toksunensis]|uniref:Uncharacterized protein n=1 Tax=Pontibacter toksunensis TaxID=1332631 RepID=A0ABW6C215_9BACT
MIISALTHNIYSEVYGSDTPARVTPDRFRYRELSESGFTELPDWQDEN